MIGSASQIHKYPKYKHNPNHSNHNVDTCSRNVRLTYQHEHPCEPKHRPN